MGSPKGSVHPAAPKPLNQMFLIPHLAALAGTNPPPPPRARAGTVKPPRPSGYATHPSPGAPGFDSHPRVFFSFHRKKNPEKDTPDQTRTRDLGRQKSNTQPLDYHVLGAVRPRAEGPRRQSRRRHEIHCSSRGGLVVVAFGLPSQEPGSILTVVPKFWQQLSRDTRPSILKAAAVGGAAALGRMNAGRREAGTTTKGYWSGSKPGHRGGPWSQDRGAAPEEKTEQKTKRFPQKITKGDETATGGFSNKNSRK